MDAKLERQYQKIADFELDQAGARATFSARLGKDNGWSIDYANRVIAEYKRFAFLAAAAGHPVCPSEQVDQAWHLHLTYTHSYWDRFCPEVLGRPLHHNPSEGGAAERAKFIDWYNQTLDSYRRFFGHEAPAEIWPDAETRFGEDLQHRRVNTRRNWIVPKAPLKWLAAGAGATVALSAVSGCMGGVEHRVSAALRTKAGVSFPNPFDLPGPQFLNVFVLALAVASCIACIVRWAIRRVDDDSVDEMADLDPYEVAYLSGGEQTAVHAAIAGLVSRDALRWDAKLRRLLHEKTTRADHSLHAAERAVLERIDANFGATFEELQHDWWWPRKIAQRLQSLGLLVDDRREMIGRVLPTLIVLLVPLLGAIKVAVGLSRDKPVLFLIVACCFAVGIAFTAFGEPLHRTTKGDRVLNQLTAQHATLKLHAHETTGTELALSVGLFGDGVLAGGPWAELQAALNPPTETAGGFSGGGCGGGGCGGGCGGCGG